MKNSFRVIIPVLALLFWHPAEAASRLYLQKVGKIFPTNSPAVPPPVMASPDEKAELYEMGPLPGMKVMAVEKGGVLWLGSSQGAARIDKNARDPWERTQYFFGKRWLADPEVQQIWINPESAHPSIWIRTKSGVANIEWIPFTLEEKARIIEDRIEARHVRHGFVSGTHLKVPGHLGSSRTVSNDNDGLWTAIYLASQSYHYAVTGSKEARLRAQRGIKALMRLEEITGIPGFPARSFVRKGVEERPGDGEWHETPDGQWLWKGDTSSDELVGHYYAYAVYYDLAADAAEKREIERVVSRLTDYLIKNNYDLLDVDGKPTRWGLWSEEYFKTEEGKYERPLRSLELLSFLKTAHHITGNPKYAEAYRDRVEKGYADQVMIYRRWPGGGEINFSDDELAYLSYQPLLQYEKDPKLRAVYLEGLRFTWSQVRRDRNPLWNYISVLCGADKLQPDVAFESRLSLERIPLDLIHWDVRNSHRKDLISAPAPDRWGRQELLFPLPPDERPISKWNNGPYRPDGGFSGQGEDDGSYFLLPYWLGRYFGYVK